MLGQDAYPDLFTKAAALLHSLARNHPLVDGNKRLAWLATYVFLAKNGVDARPDDDAAYDLVVAVASGSIDEIEEIAAVLASFVSLSSERSGGDREAVAPHVGLQGPHDLDGIVMGTRDVQGAALASERDRTEVGELPKVSARLGEVGMRREPEPGGELDGSKHQLLRQRDRRTQARRREDCEVGAHEARKVATAHDRGPDRVLDAQAERVDEPAADHGAIMAVRPSDEHQRNALGPSGPRSMSSQPSRRSTINPRRQPGLTQQPTTRPAPAVRGCLLRDAPHKRRDRRRRSPSVLAIAFGDMPRARRALTSSRNWSSSMAGL